MREFCLPLPAASFGLALDGSTFGVENGYSPFFFEAEGSMASQLERIASLESSLGWIKGTLMLLVPALIAWGAYITVNVIAIKQSLVDGGNMHIVAELKDPQSDQQLRADLATVNAQIQTARVRGEKPNQAKVDSLATALAQVIKSNPDLPDAWSATAELVSYRSESVHTGNTEEISPCDLNSRNALEQLRASTSGALPQRFAFYFSNCVFSLDDDGSFGSTQVAEFFRLANVRNPGNGNVLAGENVIFKYSGRKMIPVTMINFVNCRFDLQFPLVVPPPPGRAFADQLLIADSSKGTLQMPIG